MVVKFACKRCCKPVLNSHHAIQCDNCNIRVHVKCNRIKTHKHDIKFKVFTKKNSKQNIDLTDKINKAMDDPDFEMMTAKYYETDEISFFTFRDVLQQIFFSLLNISSLTFHFDKLIALIMAENKLNFDFLGISETLLKSTKTPQTLYLRYATILNIPQLSPVMVELCSHKT